ATRSPSSRPWTRRWLRRGPGRHRLPPRVGTGGERWGPASPSAAPAGNPTPCGRGWGTAWADRTGSTRLSGPTAATARFSDVRGGPPVAEREALADALAGLRRVDEVFSTYRDNSQIARLARGELTVGECDPDVAEVLALAEEAERLSEGWFSPRYRGRLDPT